ncbi:ABC transporter permease [Ensifer adhaerens]|uniref:ABC transporter permease n=1 Tax=Ensifer adhaerens TaxID=106592 RepID=UPI001CBD4A79|nr:ABC transporter permease [Ensifer adhaerens]MBZ7924781.1 ABC transporter permease [Ensifer adhaerens]UAX95998.1 ABC transporter permease [Ensifer adhaerens]UAY04661.1 ABC transporter permease [Ensifer adhaerens]UAY10092.1 ABC transporter permease [Ensifer adhaerens]
MAHTSERMDNRAVHTLPPLGPELRSILVRLIVLLVLCLSVSVLNENFLSFGNLVNVLRQTSLLFLIAAGGGVVIIAGAIDLSVGAILTLSACVAAGVLHATGSSALAVAVALSIGVSCGFINGLLVAWLRLPPFLVTYGMLWILSGIALYYMGGVPITGFPAEFRFLGSGFLLGLPVPIWIMAVVAILGSAVLHLTTVGQQIVMMGANRAAAALAGVPLRRNLIGVYVLSGACAGIAAVVALGRVNSADPGMGDPFLLPSIAAILVGGTSLFGGTGTLFGTALGALLLTIVLNAMNMLTISSAWQPFATGLVLVGALLADAYLNWRRA